MEKTTTHPRRARRRRRRSLLPLAILLAALAIAVPVILSLLPRQPRVEPEPEDPHAGQVYVNDGANMVWLTPHKNLAVNPFTANDFTRDENGALHYTGMSGTVRLGVDVSDYQSGTDWQQLAQQGVDFAILRVGYRGYTQGALRTDSSFRTFVRGARAAGIDVGVYFFSQAVTVQEAIMEADYVLGLLDGVPLDLPVYFDWEPVFADDSRTASFDASRLTNIAAAFCRVVEQGGCRYLYEPAAGVLPVRPEPSGRLVPLGGGLQRLSRFLLCLRHVAVQRQRRAGWGAHSGGSELPVRALTAG